jgi:murein L,D-transpeptidase YcbB/YkuD
MMTASLFFSPSGQTRIYKEAEHSVSSIPSPAMPPLQKNLFRILGNSPSAKLGFASRQDIPERLDIVVLNLYMANNISPFWVTKYGPNLKAYALTSILRRAKEEGLEPDQYRVAALTNLLHSRKTGDLARLDIMLTLAMVSYITDIRQGHAVTCMLDPRLFSAARNKRSDIQDVFQQGLTAPDLFYFLKTQAPQHKEYQSLKILLAEYRKLASRGGWPEIPTGETLRPGMTDPRLSPLAERLFITGDLTDFSIVPPPRLIAARTGRELPGPLTVPQRTIPAIGLSGPLLLPPSLRPLRTVSVVILPHRRISYTGKLVKAVKRFQFRYNLDQDGIVGKNTLNALNLSVRDHINKIILNMERWRWLPNTLNGRRILVNIAGFRLTGINDQKVEISMPVIVGKTSHKTPVFSETMTYIEVNPYWNIPSSIARNEIVAKMIKDPDYLRKQRIRIFWGWQENAPEVHPESIDWRTIGREINQYRLRQEPGAGNALGTIKFIFPNNNNVYMHDTPGHSLFRRTKRSFSHGCIRLSRPLDLAWYILNNDHQMVSRKQIQERIASKKRKIFILNQPLPVHILYRTAQVDQEDGTVHFYDDIYGRDAQLAEALFTKGKGKRCRYSY